MKDNTNENMLAGRNAAVTPDNPYIIENENVSIDVSMLYDISGNDKSFIYTMVQVFLKNMPNSLNKIQQSLNNQDWEDVYRSAHSAKSSLSVIKIKEMFDWVVQIEENVIKKTSLDSVPDLVEKIKKKYLFAEEILNERFYAQK